MTQNFERGCDFCPADVASEFSEHYWACDELACQKKAAISERADAMEERDRAHERLDRDMGW